MSKPPYEELFIYEITGDARAAAASRSLGPDYLGLWLEGDSSFLFFSTENGRLLEELTASNQELTLRDNYQMSYEAWQGGTSLAELSFDGLTITPAWQEAKPEAGPGVLRIDPGLVFGNGLHPTTSHCLELLAGLAKEGPLGRVSDLGCGTGILGLSAMTLGADSVLAVDLNPLCAETTLANMRLNELEITVKEGKAEDYLPEPAELVMANIHWEVMKELMADESALADKKSLILSGITRSYAASLERMAETAGFVIKARREAENTWFTILAQR